MYINNILKIYINKRKLKGIMFKLTTYLHTFYGKMLRRSTDNSVGSCLRWILLQSGHCHQMRMFPMSRAQEYNYNWKSMYSDILL